MPRANHTWTFSVTHLTELVCWLVSQDCNKAEMSRRYVCENVSPVQELKSFSEATNSTCLKQLRTYKTVLEGTERHTVSVQTKRPVCSQEGFPSIMVAEAGL